MMKELFKGMHWSEELEYSAMLLTVVLIPISWRLGIIGMGLMMITSVVKMTATRSVGNRSMNKLGRWTLVLMMAYWAVYVVSGLMSENRTLGLERAETRLPLLLLPMVALLSDLRYLTKERTNGQTLAWLLVEAQWALMTVIATGSMVVSGVRLLMGTPMSGLMEEHYYPMHHSYVALYVVVAMCTGWSMLREMDLGQRKMKVVLWGSEAVLALMIVMSNSRAGMLFVALLVVIVMVDLIVRGRRWKTVLLTVVILAVVGVGVYQVIPPQYKRITYAVKEMKAGRDGDIRTKMMRWGIASVEGHYVTGLGSGDYEVALQEQYRKHGFEEGVECEMGTHNQYMETLLQCGILGLLPMIGFLALPIIGRGKARYWVRLVVLAIAIEIFFESMLGRQMGVQFIVVEYILLALQCEGTRKEIINNNKENYQRHETE